MAGGIHDLSIICFLGVFCSLTRGTALNKRAHTRRTLADARAEACPCRHSRASPPVSDHGSGDVIAKNRQMRGSEVKT